MRVSTAVTLALTALLLTSLGAVAAAPSAPTPTAADRSPGETTGDPVVSTPASTDYTLSTGTAQPLPPADPSQVIRIAVSETGDTEWTIETRFLLTDDDDVETFESYAEAVTTGQRDVNFDRALFEREAADAAEATGRNMSIEGMDWDDPRIEPSEDEDDDTQIGVISYSFTWTNFATADGDRVYFEPPRDSWFTVLSDTQRLVIEAPDGYSFDEFNTPPTTSNSGEFTWDGPQEFDDGGLDIVFVRVAGPTAQGWGLFALAGAVVVVSILYFVAQRRSDDDTPAPAAIRSLLLGSRTDTTEQPADGATSDPPSQAAPEPNTNGGTDELTFEERDAVDPELLSDEERVHRLLRQNGGRMKQGSIVDETGWSNAKVSQLLSKMDEDGEIDKLRIGRENLITHPDVNPTEVD